MAPEYKLTYFNIKGLAEPIRFLFHYGGIEFEDIRFEAEQWPKIKATMPFGQVPLLEHNGKKIYQSVAICRYLGNELNLSGSTNWESLEIDAIVDTFLDFKKKVAQILSEENENVKAEKTEVLLSETLPYYFEKLDKIAKENKGYLALGKLTWADILFISRLEAINFLSKKDVIEDYPNLLQVKNNVLCNSGIQKWITSRPKSDY